jgi:hypothetical protein
MYEVLEIAHPRVSLVAASGARRHRHRFIKEKISVEEVSIKNVKSENIFATPVA